jgi:hypothetical protein
MSKSDIERAVELSKQLEDLLGDSKEETIAKLLAMKVPRNPGGLLDRGQMVELTSAINREDFDGLWKYVQDQRGGDVVEQFQDLVGSFTNDFANSVSQDIERMGEKLTHLGFPDVRTDRENWRVIAKMVGANPNDFMEDIYESALAFVANKEQSTKQADCLSETDPPPPPPPPATDPLVLARAWLDKPKKLGGPTIDQKTFVALIIKGGGFVSHADLSTGGSFDWVDPRKGATNMVKRINGSIHGGELWSIIPEDNSGCRIVLNSDLVARS